jgi:uncharacterized membrane protein (UPF0127 family)
MQRRRFLAVAATVAAGTLAGCASDEGDDASDGLAGGTLGDDRTDDPAATAEHAEGNESGDGNGTGSPDQSTVDYGPVHADAETTTVRVLSPSGEQLGQVTVAVADTTTRQYVGLSDTDSLPEDRGMLFVYDEVDRRRFVMREMDFALDIVYADDAGIITGIQHAPAPGPDEDGSEQYYPGRGQYVLEVNRGWTATRDITEGDRLAFALADRRVGDG